MVAIKSLHGGTEAAMQEGANGKEQQKRARAQDAGGRGKFGKVGEVQEHDQVNQPAALAHQMNAGEDGALDAGEDGAQDAGEAAPPTRPRKRGLRADVSKQREKAIDQLVVDATERGDCVDRFYWMLVYDLEMAPMTSNLKQLTDLGLAVPAPDDLDERELHEKLWEVVESLGDLGVFLLHTDGLSDRDLYSRLFHEILTEPVRDLPPTEGVSEFIDLLGGAARAHDEGTTAESGKKVDRDRFLPKPEGGEIKEAE